MYFKTACLLVLTVATSSWCQKNDGIIRKDFDGVHEDGSYRWALQTAGGIYHEQRGRFEQDSTTPANFLVEGQFQYTAPDGEVINVLYKADKSGFVASGDHLPTPPPVPEEIQKLIDHLATQEPPTDY
ncbi:unnamed protein product [Arctia plantaginis]|uniref:Uncharacterized protein n=1 Tax=Arctia plantaginis TaxID=874455 RepID=A0A8S0ZG33_ARCPL|nr:unnamed protein product [Arctia plantaginis]